MKIIFAISLLATGAAAVLAFMTRSSLLETRNEKDRINRDIVTMHESMEKVNGETGTKWDEWQTTMTSAKNEDIQAKSLTRETNEQDDILKNLKKEIQDIIDKRGQMEEQIKATVGESGTPEEVVAKVEALRGETDAMSAELETLKKELDVHKAAVATSTATSNRLKAEQTARAKAIRLSGRASTITAVNQEYSFAVVNIGRQDGLTMDARLLVKRGGQMIGKLNIVSIEARQTVADIDLKSLPAGFQVNPGDEVVVDNSVR